MPREHRTPEMDVPGEDTAPTTEVGSEGGTHGEVERGRSKAPTTGSEATETSHPNPGESVEIRRDETGPGRRSP